MSNQAEIRKSTAEDEQEIRSLIETCFGDRSQSHAYDNVAGRYYLYTINGKIVAMSGIDRDSPYPGLEIDWTCTLPEYRHNGYMIDLFGVMIADFENEHKDIYCSCWRWAGHKDVNLHTLMKRFDFKEVVHDRVHAMVPHNCDKKCTEECIKYSGNGCECYEDLYMRKGE